MTHRVRVLMTVCLALAVGAPTTLFGATATIYRDTWGVPNIYADTEEAGCFAMGYAQAEDRLGQIFENYRRATGTFAEVAGPEELFGDYRSRMWKHAEVARKNYDKVAPKVRACIEAFQAGIKQYMKEHPEKVPETAMEIEPWMAISAARMVIWGWPEGQAHGKLRRAKIDIEKPEYRGSNQMALAPKKTKDKVAIAVIDPHLGFYGPMRFYEARVYAGKIQAAGTAVVGMPFITLGHNEYASVAMTTSAGPDTADVFVETLNPDDPTQYKYDGKWRTGTLETIRIAVKTKDGKVDHAEKKILYTHHGPVVAVKDGKGYAMALAYFDQLGLADQSYQFLLSKNIADVKKALSMCQLMPQNVMVATVDGDIYYQRTGRVPIRPDGHDYTLPVPGDTSETEWKGFHPSDDLVQILNPEPGWMQNCNIAPRVMFKDSPLTPDKYKPYIYREEQAMGIKYGLHQRAAMTFQQLDQIQNATLEDVFELATSPQVYGIKPWQDRLRKAWDSADETAKNDAKLKAFAEAILNWNGRAEKDSTGILCYRAWKEQQPRMVKVYARLGAPPPKHLTDEKILETLKAGYEYMVSEYGRMDVKYGDVYRVGRRGGKRTAPAEGGSVNGVATPRALGFGAKNDKGQHLMGGGQCSLQVVKLTKPPKSWTAAPLGQSDDPNSPHFDDQAIKLVGNRKLKSTYFKDKEALLKNLESKKVLTYKP